MPGKCAKCVIDFGGSDVIAKCVECKQEYHPACTSAGSAQNFTKNKNRLWKCDVCKDDSSTSSQISNEGAATENKNSILDAIKSLRGEIISRMDSKIDGLNSSINTLSEDIRSLQLTISNLSEGQQELGRRCAQLEAANSHMEDELWTLKCQLYDNEQHSRSANLEVVGIPVTKGESVYSLLQAIAAAIGVPFKREDVSIAHRLRLHSNKHAHPPLIVQFTSRTVREMWLSAVRTKKNLDANEIAASLPATKVFINEHLTPNNKMLLGRARRLRRDGKLHYAGFSNGKVLIKVKEGDTAIRVLRLEDLDRYK